MQIRRIQPENISHAPCVACIGFFDGIHLGHVELIRETQKIAAQLQYPAVLITFDPDPKDIYTNQKNVHIVNNDEKAVILERCGLDEMILIEFSQAVADLSKEEFIEKYLKQLNVRYLICGFDFTFGRYGAGNTDTLKDSGIPLSVIDCVNYKGEKIDSQKIKEAIENGNIELANRLLYCPYFIQGQVVYGKQVGRTIQFPTANIRYSTDKLLPKVGVYAGRIQIRLKTYYAMINVGNNPTLYADYPVTVEAHILDFDEEIYGENVLLEFDAFLREEHKFSSLNALKEQLSRDINSTREYFKTVIY